MKRIRFIFRNDNDERKEFFQDQLIQYRKLISWEITQEEFRQEKKLTRDKIIRLNNELKKMKEELRENEKASKNSTMNI